MNEVVAAAATASSVSAHTMLGRLKVCLKTTQSTSPNAWTTSSLTLAVAVAVRAMTGTAGKLSLSTFRPCGEDFGK
jgi:hypothetical protein